MLGYRIKLINSMHRKLHLWTNGCTSLCKCNPLYEFHNNLPTQAQEAD